MTSNDREALDAFKGSHFDSVKKMMKETGKLSPMIHLYGRKGDTYVVGICPIIGAGSPPIYVLKHMTDQLYDEFLCICFSSEATIWKVDMALLPGVDRSDPDKLSKNDPAFEYAKKNAVPMDVIFLTFESESGVEQKVYEIKRTGGSMVTAYGDLSSTFELVEVLREMKNPDGFGGRFANLYRKIKNYKQ